VVHRPILACGAGWQTVEAPDLCHHISATWQV